MPGMLSYQRNIEDNLSKTDILLRLYSLMEKTIHETKKAIELHDVSKKGVLCDRALSILSVLQVALQEEIYPELFTPLSQLYVFFGDCFLESSQNLNGKLLDDILPVWQTLHQAWRQAVDIDQKTD